jgi:copper chaperone NosL
MTRSALVVAALCSMVLLSACQPKPEPIRFGEEVCAYCRMGISDPRFGAELLTRQGRVYKFDALECMVEFERSGALSAERIHSRWVVDFGQPGELIPVEEAEFVHAPNVHSPMGLNVYAVARGRYDADSLLPRGQRVSWEEVVQLVQRLWQSGPPRGSAP